MPLWERLIRSGGWWDVVDDIATHLVRDTVLAAPRSRSRACARGRSRTPCGCVGQRSCARSARRAGSTSGCSVDVIEPNIEEPDFFSRKAIGWALRDHARWDPAWVRRFAASIPPCRASPVARRSSTWDRRRDPGTEPPARDPPPRRSCLPRPHRRAALPARRLGDRRPPRHGRARRTGRRKRGAHHRGGRLRLPRLWHDERRRASTRCRRHARGDRGRHRRTLACRWGSEWPRRRSSRLWPSRSARSSAPRKRSSTRRRRIFASRPSGSRACSSSSPSPVCSAACRTPAHRCRLRPGVRRKHRAQPRLCLRTALGHSRIRVGHGHRPDGHGDRPRPGPARHARARQAPLHPHPGRVLGAARTGIPLLIRTLALRAALLLTTWLAASYGDVTLAAHQVALTVWSFLAFALDALAIAAQAIVGRSLGAGDREGVRSAMRTMIRWGVWGGLAHRPRRRRPPRRAAAALHRGGIGAGRALAPRSSSSGLARRSLALSSSSTVSSSAPETVGGSRGDR